MTELTAMRNIAKELEKKTKNNRYQFSRRFEKVGSKEAFFKLKMRFPEVCLVHLYTLEGAITDTDFNKLSEEIKKDLKEFSDEWK